jgi:YVTN family beta-propeller protein
MIAATAASIAGLTLSQPAMVRAQPVPEYVITKTVPLGKPDEWDYVTFDPGSHRVYVAHGDRVDVIDGHDGAVVGQVAGFAGGTHGIAIVPEAGRGYTDDGDGGFAVSFDLKTLKASGKQIKAAEDADGVVFDPASGHVFVVNGHPGTLTVIDPASDRAIATVRAGSALEYAVVDGGGKLYVNSEGKNEIVRVDTKTNRADAHWPMPGCKAPHGLAIDVTTHRLFSSCVNRVLEVVSSDTGALVASLPIGLGTDAVAFDPKRKLVFASSGLDGTLSIVEERDANSFKSLGTIQSAPAARTMGLDPETGRVYLVAAEVDTQATVKAGAPAATAADPDIPSLRMTIVPGSLKLLFLDPVPRP